MVYRIIISPRAQSEIIKAIDFYALDSIDAPSNFVNQLQKVYEILTLNPFFRLQYKSVRSLKIKKFPYSIYYTIDKDINSIRVLSCFHNKRNPKKRP